MKNTLMVYSSLACAGTLASVYIRVSALLLSLWGPPIIAAPVKLCSGGVVADVWDRWIPGVLSKRQLEALSDATAIQGADPGSLDESSVDLRLGDEGYRLTKGSVKPFGSGFVNELLKHGLAVPLQPTSQGEWILQPRNTYVFRLRERLGDLKKSIWGQATAKSSVGRLDVLARLIVDGMKHYEKFNPKYLSSDGSDMFLEITPMTFPVRVRSGIPVTQLRLFYGPPDDCELRSPEVINTCLTGSKDGEPDLTVDLSNVDVYDGRAGCAFRALRDVRGETPLPLWLEKEGRRPDPGKWWELIQSNKEQRLRIRNGRFYILRSKERLTLPAGVAVYARAIDEEIGEMRIHYAGFAHPFFGWLENKGGRGNPLVFEVRGHDVDVNLRDGEVLARLQFFRMSQDAERPKADVKAKPAGVEEPNYEGQTLSLSKYFSKTWETAPKLVNGIEMDSEV